jgi:hypothetical protein
MFHTTPAAVVWTNIEPDYQCDLRDYISTDIRAIQVWLAREAELLAFRKLGDNWDGFDAVVPDDKIVQRAVSFLHIVRDRDRSKPPKRVVLSPDGLIALEWVEGNTFVQAEVGASNEIEWMFATPGKPTEFRVESIAVPSDSAPAEGHAWQPPATVAADERVYVSAL